MREPHTLRLRRLGIDTHQELVVYMRQDCHICRSEGFAAQARIQVTANGHSIIATLGKITSDLLGHGEASLSESAWRLLGVAEGSEISFAHPPLVESLGLMRGKIYGQRLDTRAGAADHSGHCCGPLCGCASVRLYHRLFGARP